MNDPNAISKTINQQLLTIDGRIGEIPLPELLARVGASKAADPSDPDADCDRAVIFEAMGHSSAVGQAISEALRLNPHHPRALQLRSDLGAIETPAGELAEHSMLSKERLDTLRDLAHRAINDHIPGDFIECGVAGGGSLLTIARVLNEHNDTTRRCIGLDTFAGMPAPTDHDTAHGVHAQSTGWGHGTCSSGGVDRIRAMLETKGLSNRVELIEGLFDDTLPPLRQHMINEGRTIALLHCDADWYSSTVSVSTNLFDLVTPGGLVQIDDYGHWDGCRAAIDEALAHINPVPELHRIDYTGRWFQMPTTQDPKDQA